jgi:hypothetical protein
MTLKANQMPEVPTIGYEYSVQWHNPKTEPPPGMARVLIKAFAFSTRPEHKPEAIVRKLAELGFGSGWVLCSQAITPPAKRHTAERRARQRVGNLTRRVEKTIGPLFSQEVVAEAVARKPDYYAGAVDEAQAAHVAQIDARDAELWAAYLAWYTEVRNALPLAVQVA